MSEDKRKNEIIREMLDVDFYPSVSYQDFDEKRYHKIPFSEAADMGVAFASLPKTCRTIVESVNAAGVKGGEGLYYARFPKGVTGHLATMKDGSGNIGAIFNNNGLVGQARLVKAEKLEKQIVVPYDPTALFMGMALFCIDKKLSDIQKTQQEMIARMKEKDLAELKAGLEMLSDIHNSYKYNWNDETFIRINLNQVKNIKSDAKTKMEFYRGEIEKILKKKNLIRTNTQLKDIAHKMNESFKFYQFSMYIYSFASYLEVMLMANFSTDYLRFVADTINDQVKNYKELYARSRKSICEYGDKAIEKLAMNGVAAVNETTGRVIRKIPIVEKGPVDEILIGSGKILEGLSYKELEKVKADFDAYQDPNVNQFVDSVNIVDVLYNEPVEFLFDQENLYIPEFQSDENK
ncbi:MAG: hypothetical protein ACOYJJ_05320 [Anaerovoracaceae bacterium]